MKKKRIIDLDEACLCYEKKTGQKISRRQLADAIGINYQTGVNWQNGKVPENMLKVLKICDLTGISMENLIKTRDE